VSAEPAPRPWQRLSWRITMFFLLAAVPGVLLAGGTVFILDRLIKDEIAHRGTETHAATERALEMQRRRVEEQLAALSKHEALRQLAVAIDDEGAVERAEPLAGALAASLGLDLMAIGARRGPGANTLISSAHLRDAIGDAIPRDIPAGGTPRAGFVRELVAGNPPERVPALVAAVSLDDDTGRPALVVYGGVRLDADLLDAIARGAGATLILEAPGAPAERFPRGARAAESATSVGVIELPTLAREGGRARHARVEVVVDIGRLVHARRRVLGLAGGLTVAALCGAVLAGTWLSRRISRPIVELSRAAGAIGAGALDVQVPGGGRDELGTLVTAFNDMVGELKESRERVARAERVAAWREAARRIAHEIKNPLFPMQMAMDTLRKAFRTQHPELPAIAEESTKVVLEEIRSISRLVSEFSEFARLPRPRLEPTDPVALLGHAAALHAHRPDGAQLVLERARLEAVGLPRVMADGEQITRALTNLVKNAMEAIGPSAGTVTLDAEESRRGARRGVALTVRDTGPGMTDEVRARLFEPYFTTKTEGTGLGLSIVERIIAEHDGALDVESELGRGTVFRVWLAAEDAA
jgi:two-component system nitrogen regulation sensor histidine kinase NtrY